MPESAVITEGTQIGVEAAGSPGVPVPANRILTSMSIDPFTPDIETDTFRPRGFKYPTRVDPLQEWAVSSLSGRPDYGEIIYPFACVLGRPVSTQIMDAATATGAYRHLFSPSTTNTDDAATLTVEQKNAAYTQRVAYALLTSLGMSWSRTAAPDLTGDVMAQLLEDGIAMTAAPTPVAGEPVVANKIDIFMDNTAAALGTTKLLRALAASWNIGDRFSAIWPLNSAKPSFDGHVEGEPSNDLTITYANDAAARALLSTVRGGLTKFFRIEAVGSNIYTNGAVVHNHRMRLDFAAKINAGWNAGDENGLSTIEWPWTIVHDATWGRAFQFEVINKVPAL